MALTRMPPEILLLALEGLTTTELSSMLKVNTLMRAVTLKHESTLGRKIIAAQKARLQAELQCLDFSGVAIVDALQRYIKYFGHSYCRETDWFEPPWASNFANLYANKTTSGVFGSTALDNVDRIRALVHGLFTWHRTLDWKDSTLQLPTTVNRLGGRLTYVRFRASIFRNFGDLRWTNDELEHTYELLSEGEVFGEGYAFTEKDEHDYSRIEYEAWLEAGHGSFHQALLTNTLVNVEGLLPEASMLRLFDGSATTGNMESAAYEWSPRPLEAAAMFERARICDLVEREE